MKHSVAIGDLVLPVVIRRYKHSKRITLRYHPRPPLIALNLPRYVSLRQGLSFVDEKREWIAARMGEHPPRVPFADGQEIELLGQRCRLRHVGGRGVVRMENGVMLIPGAAEFMARRVRDFLKSHALQEIMRMVDRTSALMGRAPRRVTLRDTSSRWGSCSSGGNLSFSWRLVFAPREVLEYMVCHEMAHLAHMNHSAQFWAQVAALFPGYERAQQWLRAHGHTLQRYG